MSPDGVADVGNSRIKWGRCRRGAVGETVFLDPGDIGTWEQAYREWAVPRGASWAVAGTDPERRDALAEWLRQHHQKVLVLHQRRQVPLEVRVDEPERVGLDRLLNALAARAETPAGQAAIMVDAGSAVTVDLLDEAGVFRGGAIFPGLRLMALALHEHTAALPRVEVRAPVAPPGTNTERAIAAGLWGALAGGIGHLVRALRERHPQAVVNLGGGDGGLLAEAADLQPLVQRPRMTLEGIRLAADAAG